MTIAVQDVNDNTPNIIVNVLTESGSAEVRENVDEAGTFVAHLSAHDADSGAYGRVECQLSDGEAHLFRLVPLYDSSDTRYLTVSCRNALVAVLAICIPAFILCSEWNCEIFRENICFRLLSLS